MTTLVKRTTLIVRSLERSVAFYGDVLGLSKYYDDEIVLSGVGLAAASAATARCSSSCVRPTRSWA